MAENLETLKTLVDEMKAHGERLDQLARDSAAGKAVSVPLLQQELGQTIMPLLYDFAAATFTELYNLRTYLHDEVEPLLLDAAGEASLLVPEDSDLIMQRLVAYHTILEQMLSVADTEERKTQISAEIGETDKAMALVGEITVEDDEDEDDDDDPEGEGDDDDDDAPEGSPTRQ